VVALPVVLWRGSWGAWRSWRGAARSVGDGVTQLALLQLRGGWGLAAAGQVHMPPRAAFLGCLCCLARWGCLGLPSLGALLG
jgi:hypothetical protein